ncbi:MAG: hypothetical protein D6816_03015 [Bacteroidetes bacterium]|nr:MAG: hypothetical protein D6816_03015 [Bacteroidota bacterium]
MSNPDSLDLIADDYQMISYRPRWNKVTGSVNATILLQQIIYRWVNHGRRPFYKFQEPCEHPACRPGDSWCEELGFSRYEFQGARKLIAVKTKQTIAPDAFVSYWMDGQRKTWYALNETAVVKALSDLYPEDDPPVGVQTEPQLDHNLSRKNQDSIPQVDNNLSGKTSDSTPKVDHNLSRKNQDSTPHLSGKNRDSKPFLSGKNRDSTPSYLGKTEIAIAEKPRYLTTKDNNIGDVKTKDDFFDSNLAKKTKSIWDAALGDLQMQMTKSSFSNLLAGSQLRIDPDGRIWIITRSDYSADWINFRLTEVIKRTLAPLLPFSPTHIQAVSEDMLADDKVLPPTAVPVPGGG